MAIFHENYYKLSNYFSIKWIKKNCLHLRAIWTEKKWFLASKYYKCCLHMSTSWIQQIPPTSAFFFFLSIWLVVFVRNYQNIFDQILRKLWNLPFHKAGFSEKDMYKVFSFRSKSWQVHCPVLQEWGCTRSSYVPCWVTLIKINKTIPMDKVKARWGLEFDFPNPTFISFAGQNRQVNSF